MSLSTKQRAGVPAECRPQSLSSVPLAAVGLTFWPPATPLGQSPRGSFWGQWAAVPGPLGQTASKYSREGPSEALTHVCRRASPLRPAPPSPHAVLHRV